MSIVKEKSNDNESLNASEEEKDNANGNVEKIYISPEMVLRLPTITDSKFFPNDDVSLDEIFFYKLYLSWQF